MKMKSKRKKQEKKKATERRKEKFLKTLKEDEKNRRQI
jgi:hypothetical protein